MQRTEGKRVKRYKLQIGSSENRILLFEKLLDRDPVAVLLFTDKSKSSKSSATQIPQITFPLSQYPTVVDMLRHEGPILLLQDEMCIETDKRERVGQDET
jgi:hypothetical protein